jgi:hypothetical protein
LEHRIFGHSHELQRNAQRFVSLGTRMIKKHSALFPDGLNDGSQAITRPPMRVNISASRGACLACEAVVRKAKDRADSPLCRALGREEEQVLT